jgi:hypothetical protein
MIQARVDRVLDELQQRYGNDERFVSRARPIVRRIFEPGMSEEQRTLALEMLAETCVRDVQIRDNCAAAKAAWAEFFAKMRRHVERLTDAARRQPGDSDRES